MINRESCSACERQTAGIRHIFGGWGKVGGKHTCCVRDRRTRLSKVLVRCVGKFARAKEKIGRAGNAFDLIYSPGWSLVQCPRRGALLAGVPAGRAAA